MANKVEIIVVAKDNTKVTFDAIEARAKTSGEKTGKATGDGIKKGIEDSVKNAKIGDIPGFEDSGRKAGTNFGTGFVGSMASVASSAGGALASGIEGVLTTGSGPIAAGLMAGLIAGIVAASPLLAAALGGAIAGGGVLTAVIGGAILAAVSSDEVKTAGEALKTNLFASLSESAQPFVAPLLEAITAVSEKAQELRPILDNLFANSAELVQPLVDSLLNFAESIATGMDSLVENAGPEIMAEIGAGITSVGDSLQYMLEKFGETEGLAEGLGTIFTVASEAIVIFTDIIAALARVYDGLIDKIRALREEIDPQEGKWVKIAEGAKQASDAIGGIAAEAERATSALTALADAQLAQIDPVVQYYNAVEKANTKLGEYNAAVEKYGAGSQQAAAAGAELTQAWAQQDAAAAKAAESTGISEESLKRHAEAAGLDAGQTDNLKTSVDAARASLEKYAVEWVAKIVADTAEAQQKIGAVAAGIAAIPSSKTVTVNVVAVGAVGLAGFRSGGSVGARVQKAATGGNRGNMVMVGEEGPEIVRLPYGSTVIPNGQTRRFVNEERDKAVESTMRASTTSDNGPLLAAIESLGDRIERMQLVFDGRVLGSIQGRDSDLRYRTA